MKDKLFQSGGIQTVWGQPKVVYLTFEEEESPDTMSDNEIGMVVSALNRSARGLIKFSTEPAPESGEPTVISLERPAKRDYKSLLQEIRKEILNTEDTSSSGILDNISNSINNFSSKFNLPTIEFDKEKTDFMEGDFSFTVSSPVNPYFGTEGTMTYSYGGLEVEKQFTSDGVITTYTYDKSAAYANAEYTSHGKPVGKYNRGSGSLNISGPWGSYSGTNLVSNGSNTYDGTFGAPPALQNAMGGMQEQLGIDQIVYLDFDGALTEFEGEKETIEGIQVENSGITEVRAAAIAAELNKQYKDTGVVFVTEKPVLSEYSTVYIGDTDSFYKYGDIKGISEKTDEGNQNKSDNAFVMLNAMSSNSEIIEAVSEEVKNLVGIDELPEKGLDDFAENSGNETTDSEKFPWLGSVFSFENLNCPGYMFMPAFDMADMIAFYQKSMTENAPWFAGSGAFPGIITLM